MQSRIIAITLAAALAAPALAHAGPPLQRLAEHAAQKEWPDCLIAYRDALRAGATDASPVGDATAGKVAAACLAGAKAAPDRVDVWTEKLQVYVIGFRSDIARLESGEDNSYDTVQGQADTCNDIVLYASQILDPSAQLAIFDWKGTVGDAKAICDRGAKAADAIKAKLLGPFMKAGIKGDRLDTLSAHLGTAFIVPGGETTTDPRTLAAAHVWFLDFDGGSCARGSVTSVERFQFDKDQKLVKSSSKDYCGDVPKSAYR